MSVLGFYFSTVTHPFRVTHECCSHHVKGILSGRRCITTLYPIPMHSRNFDDTIYPDLPRYTKDFLTSLCYNYRRRFMYGYGCMLHKTDIEELLVMMCRYRVQSNRMLCTQHKVKWLIRNGIDPNCVNNSQTTPLLACVYANDTYLMEILVRNGAEIDRELVCKDTVLMEAARLDLYDSVTTLIGLGANINHENTLAETALHYACCSTDREVSSISFFTLNGSHNHRSDVISYLIEHGADPNSRDHRGLTPLMRAVERGNEVAVMTLLRLRVGLDNFDHVLHCATVSEHTEIYGLLLKFKEENIVGDIIRQINPYKYCTSDEEVIDMECKLCLDNQISMVIK